SRVTSVRFRNVPSFVLESGMSIEVDGRPLSVDISFGGAFYASVRVGDVGLSVQPKHLNELIRIGRAVKSAIHERLEVVHPLEPELRDVYGVIFFEDVHPIEKGAGEGDELVQRNVTIFADGEVDRSPCGSGTSARLALLDADRTLARGRTLRHLGILDTAFVATVVGDAAVGTIAGVVTEVEGSASPTGRHHFVLDPDDPVGTGFLLR
ncbi:MAG TPA: proline racemase family protein, partial [Actinomycetota bacterium]|nr:proline racemase family protein [Actinomycetota bacterium]